MLTQFPELLRVNFDSRFFGVGQFEFALKCPIGCRDYQSVLLSAVDIVRKDSSAQGVCSSFAGASVSAPSSTLPSWHRTLYSRQSYGTGSVRPLLAMSPFSRSATILSSSTLLRPEDSAQCVLVDASSHSSLLFFNSAPLITSLDQPFVGLIQGLFFKYFRLVFDGQLPQFPINAELFASSQQTSWQVMSRDSYSNASFPEGSALTHYAVVLPDTIIMNMNWTFYGSNDRSTWSLLHARKLGDPTMSSISLFSLHQPYPIGSNLHNSSCIVRILFQSSFQHIFLG